MVNSLAVLGTVRASPHSTFVPRGPTEERSRRPTACSTFSTCLLQARIPEVLDCPALRLLRRADLRVRLNPFLLPLLPLPNPCLALKPLQFGQQTCGIFSSMYLEDQKAISQNSGTVCAFLHPAFSRGPVGGYGLCLCPILRFTGEELRVLLLAPSASSAAMP